MTDLLLQPAPARGPNDYEVIADDWIVGRICCPMLHRPRGHGCGRWITSSIKTAPRRTATRRHARRPWRCSLRVGDENNQATARELPFRCGDSGAVV